MKNNGKNKIINLFDLYASIYDPFMKLFGLYRRSRIIGALKLKKNYKVLDIGGGTGFIASKIAEKTSETVVLDDSANMLKQAEKHPGLVLVNAKAQDIPYKSGYFDAVLCTDALHHIKDIETAIKEMKRVLKKSGRLVILEFDIKGLKGALLWVFEKLFIDNSRFIKPGELVKILEKAKIKGKIEKMSDIEYMFSGRKIK